eukprot:TRINITY_DN59214_c0_g1_i1.p1 TRINITY_DN59214_c0_g1~~TRINITY_DN59214_c0_g1_i1.p1  ORF type:complete len:235 (+),score=28.98 TRINITY_DN59214_c0_g1_i1:35-706(+)
MSEIRGASGSVAGALTVAVTSSNSTKLDAVRDAFEVHFATNTSYVNVGQRVVVRVLPRPCDSGIPHGQPWGLQHTYEGALTRLHHLKQISDDPGIGECKYLVSVENGVVALLKHDETLGQDVCCVVVEDVRTGRQAMNFSQARPYPLASVQTLKRAGTSNEEIGKFCNDWYQQHPFPISRDDQVRCATSMALAMLQSEEVQYSSPMFGFDTYSSPGNTGTFHF